MTRDALVFAAEERLLSAALAELAVQPRAAFGGWLATWWRAALVLLGLAVAVGTGWLVREQRNTIAPSPEPQEAEPLPPPARIDGHEALLQLLREAPGTRHLWAVVPPADVATIAKFAQLEQLLLEPKTDAVGGAADAAWSLQPLLGLQHLTGVTIGYIEKFPADEIARLAALPKLSRFGLIGSVHTVDAALGKTMRALRLRQLSLEAVAITPEGLAEVCAMTGLEQLSLAHCGKLEAGDLLQLGRLSHLRTLHLHGIGGALAAALVAGNLQGGGPPRVVLTPAVMQALAKLPELRELGLDGSPLDGAVLAALPPQLERLGLRECPVDADDTLRRCAALPKLRALSCSVPSLLSNDAGADGQARRQAALCALLDRQLLRELRFVGAITEVVAASLGRQMALEELEFHNTNAKDAQPIELFASLPKLQRLRLLFVPATTDPEPLRKLPSLRRVELYEPEPDALAAFRKALGERVVQIGPEY